MRICMRDGRTFEGTALQIVQAMRSIAFGVDDFDIPKYAAWVADNARKFDGVDLTVSGEDDQQVAESLVASMLQSGLAERMV